MQVKNYSSDHQEQIEQILDFLMARAKGEVPTGAKFIREYILNHPLYNQDSQLTPCVQYALINTIMKLGCGEHQQCCHCEQDTNSDSVREDDQCQEHIIRAFQHKINRNKEGFTIQQIADQKAKLLEEISKSSTDGQFGRSPSAQLEETKVPKDKLPEEEVKVPSEPYFKLNQINEEIEKDQLK